MAGKIIFVLTAVFTQEFVTLNSLLFAAHQGLYSGLLIFILFIIATIIDIIIGFYVGMYLRKKTSRTKFARYIEKQSEKFSFSKDSPKRWISLLILGNIGFCYLNAAIAGYLELPFWESQAYNFFGNLAGYIAAWYVIGGLGSLFKNTYVASGAIIVFSVLVLLILRRMHIKKV